ncbi:unnamed protein product [Phytomonas sp. EM1]|nr:unnamed protein product [Phytomonas sp. EM1]|eukprot:CCW61048.1 unnamed protein product [Phytomonas sp. isolate EM1]
MPQNPKKKLRRLGEARPGKPNLESAADEKIDAVTSEPLIPGRFVEVVSPDGTLRLFYNASTLIRIATDKGGFMQPPHFREPMEESLREKIELMEGKRFCFEARDALVPSGEFDEESSSAIIHRHAYFQQIVDEFYSLSSAEVYVCPVCLEHCVKTRYIPLMSSEGRGIEYMDDGATPVIDPLDVLTRMHAGGAEGVERSRDAALIWVAFRTAALWKLHMGRHHGIRRVAARDYRLRDLLCSFFSHFNRLQEEKYEARRKACGEAKKRTALTQQRYWQLNSRYNCLRYNRIVDGVELAAATHAEAIVEQTVFPAGEAVGEGLNLVEVQAEDSDFIVDDGESEDDGFAPHYIPGPMLGAEQPGRRSAEACCGRGRRLRSDSSSRSMSRESASTSCSAMESSTGDEVEPERTETDDGCVEECTRIQRGQGARRAQGLWTTLNPHYERLSGEGRRFLEAAVRRPVAPSRLYDPILHRVSASRGGKTVQPASGELGTEDGEEIDWESIGGTLTASHRPSQAQQQQPLAVAAEMRAKGLGDGLLVLDAEDDVGAAPGGAGASGSAVSGGS